MLTLGHGIGYNGLAFVGFITVKEIEQRFIKELLRIIPDFDYKRTYFAKSRRNIESIATSAALPSTETPATSKSDRVE